MKYQIEFKPRALKDCKNIEKKILNENYESLRALRGAKAKEGDAKTVSFENAKKVLNIKI